MSRRVAQIGDVLTARGREDLKVVALNAGNLIVQPVAEFGPTRILPAAEAAAYNATPDDAPDETTAWQRLTPEWLWDRTRRKREAAAERPEAEPLKTPEEVFAAAEGDDAN